jgi:UDP-glucose 4-epimerase
MPTKSKQHILIVGGAGYIGSHMVKCAERAGYIPIVLDNLSTGHEDAVQGTEIIVGDIQDTQLLKKLFSRYDFSAVMHFASFIQVGESVKEPAKYYYNNVSGTLNLLNEMLAANIKFFIFSSTAAVYGDPNYTPIDEKHPLLPINPYGRSKWMVEQVLQDFAKSYSFHFAALRYFNAAGCDADSGLTERHDPETHLIPLVLQVANAQRKFISIYGNDYPTFDGTCIRDYIHVNDICEAHMLALQKIWQGANNCIYNLGTGEGYSVQQVIDVARDVTGHAIPTVIEARRAGDPAILVADATAAMQELNWKPTHSALRTIVQDAWGRHN